MQQETYMGSAGIAVEPEILGQEQTGPTDQNNAIPGLFVIEVLTLFARHKRLIALGGTIGALIGVAASLLLPVEYTSQGRIMPPQQTPSSSAILMSQSTGAASSLVAGGGSALLGLRNPSEIYIGMLNSRTIADSIMDEFKLCDVYRVRDGVEAREKLKHATSIVAEKSGMIAISVTDRDRTRAARIAGAYIEHLRTLTKQLAVTEASQRREFYDEQLKGAKDNLVAAEFQLRQVQQRKGVIQPDAQGRAVIGELADLHARIAAKQVELQAHRSFSTEHNPDVQLLQSQLESMRQEQVRLERGSGSSGSTASALQDLAGSGLEYLNAAHELQYRQTLFDLLVKQYDSARLDEAKEAAIIQVVDSPVAPDRRSFPRRSLITVMCVVLGASFACAYLFLAELTKSNPQLAVAFESFKSALLSR